MAQARGDRARISSDPLERVDWDLLGGDADRLLMHRRGWLEFVPEITGGEIVIAQLELDGQTGGFYSGMLFRRCGAAILGSPFRGRTTAYIGVPPASGRLSARDAERARPLLLSRLRREIVRPGRSHATAS